MQRRHFIMSASATFAIAPLPVLAASALDYQDGLVDQRLAAGETLFLDYKASWCTTCKAQERVIKALKSSNPAYEQAITFINVDWDKWGKSDIVSRYKVPRRSTLIALKGNQELGRIVAGTSKGKIQALMDTALQAATA